MIWKKPGGTERAANEKAMVTIWSLITIEAQRGDGNAAEAHDRPALLLQHAKPENGDGAGARVQAAIGGVVEALFVCVSRCFLLLCTETLTRWRFCLAL